MKGVGKYVLGRMFFDAHLVEQNDFYLSDIINQRQLDDLDAKQACKESFPWKFMDRIGDGSFFSVSENEDRMNRKTGWVAFVL